MELTPAREWNLLYEWSVEHPAQFWATFAQFADIITERKYAEPLDVGSPGPWDIALLGGDRVAPPDPDLGPKWFPKARLNFAENLLRHRDSVVALTFWNEQGRQSQMTYAELADAVAAFASALRSQRVGVGDRVAAFMPNLPETVIGMLATASIGAIWSSRSPAFGVNGVLDRLGQIQPKVLIIAASYP